jgi:hypothetical protein
MSDRPRFFWIGIALALSIAAACTVAAVSSSHSGTGSAQPDIVAASTQPPGIPIGLDYGNTLFNAGSSKIATGLEDAKKLGASWVRLDLPWDGVQDTSSSSAYDWSHFDELVDAANSRGLELLVTVVDPPTWARTPGCNTQESCEPLDPKAYAAFAAHAAARYAPYGVHDWEIWNEENLGSFAVSAHPAAAYETLLSDSYTAIHQADKHSLVMIGGLGMSETDPSQNWIGAYSFLSEVAVAGGLDFADAIGVHPYDWNHMPADSAAFKLIDGTGESLESILETYGHSGTPFWITETGAPTSGSGSAASTDSTGASHVTYTRQAQLATATVVTETADPHIRGLFWYTDTDLPGSGLYYGLRTAHGAAKPAFSALQEAIAAYRASL